MNIKSNQIKSNQSLITKATKQNKTKQKQRAKKDFSSLFDAVQVTDRQKNKKQEYVIKKPFNTDLSILCSMVVIAAVAVVVAVVVVVTAAARPSNAFAHHHHNHHHHHHHHHHRRIQLLFQIYDHNKAQHHGQFLDVRANTSNKDYCIECLQQKQKQKLRRRQNNKSILNLNRLRGGSSGNDSKEVKVTNRFRTLSSSSSSSALMMASTASNIRGGGGGGGGGGGSDDGNGGDEQEIEETDRSEETSSTSTSTSTSEEEEQYRRRGMTIALILSNFSVMGAKCALPSVLSLLMSSDRGLTFIAAAAAGATATATATASASSAASSLSLSLAQNQFSKLLGISTLSIAIGKLVLGPVIDKLGGIRSLQITLILLIAMLTIISCTQQFIIFAVCWILVDFVFSSCWASCISSIQQSFPSNEWGKQIGNLATGARLGNAVSFSLFAGILYILENKINQPWRIIFIVSTILQIIPLGLLYHFGTMTINKNNNENNRKKKINTTTATTATTAANDATATKNPTFSDSLYILKKETTTPEFWLHLISRSCLMVFASFLLFVPTLMNQVYGCSNAVSAQVASAYSLGCLLSVSFGSNIFARLGTSSSPKKQIVAIICLLSLASLASFVQLANALGTISLTWTMSTLSMFIWGFAFSLPFYLPSSLYALERGGRECSASIADCFDFFGFALLACFNKYVASIKQHSIPSSWIGCFRITTACSIIAMITQSLAVFLEKKKKRTAAGTIEKPAVA